MPLFRSFQGWAVETNSTWRGSLDGDLPTTGGWRGGHTPNPNSKKPNLNQPNYYKLHSPGTDRNPNLSTENIILVRIHRTRWCSHPGRFSAFQHILPVSMLAMGADILHQPQTSMRGLYQLITSTARPTPNHAISRTQI